MRAFLIGRELQLEDLVVVGKGSLVALGHENAQMAFFLSLAA